MKPLIVKYRHRHSLYNLEDQYPVSSLVMDICYEYDLAPSRVAFTTKSGDPLPEDGILSDIQNFERSKLIHVFVDDVPYLQHYPSKLPAAVEPISNPTISVSVGGDDKVFSKEVKPEETLGSLLGELVLRDLIKLDLDVSLKKAHYNEKDSEKAKERDRSPTRSKSIEEYAGFSLMDEMDVKDNDMLRIVDKKAVDENEKRKHADILIECEGQEKSINKSISIASTVSQVLGSFLQSGDAGTKFDLEPEPSASQVDSEADALDKKRSSRQRTKLRLTTTEPTATTSIPEVEAPNFEVTCRFYNHSAERWTSKVFSFAALDDMAVLQRRLRDDADVSQRIIDIVADGRSLLDLRFRLPADTRALQSCGIKPGALITVSAVGDRPLPVQAVRTYSASDTDEFKPLQLSLDGTLRSLRSHMVRAFGVPEAKIRTLFQIGRRASSGAPVDLEVHENGTRWADRASGQLCGHISVGRETERLMHVVDEAGTLVLADGKTPIVYFMDGVEYYVSAQDAACRLEALPVGARPWRDLKYVALFTGIQVKDRRVNRFSNDPAAGVLFFVQTGNLFADIRSGESLRREDIARGDMIDIPVASREISFFITFLKRGAEFPRLKIPEKHNIRVWTRDGFVCAFDKGFVHGGGAEEKSEFQWSRQFRGSSQLESQISRHCRSLK